jgi:membrane peptidoglycan carboxypeptidase
VHDSVKRTVVTGDAIALNAKNAIIAIEDKDFYQHHGIKISSIIRGALSQVIPVSKQGGGSTITQQLIKNTILNQQKSLSRKIKEWVLAVKLERVMTKDQILTTYLNEAPYGGQIYGIEEASQSFFNKKASEIDLAESAYLAAIPNLPTYYSPYGKNRDKLEERKNLVLKEMLRNNFLKQADYDKAIKEKVEFLPKADSGIKAPHFVMFVLDLLEKKYGSQVLDEGGLRITTTLDYGLQNKIENVAGPFAIQNKKNFEAENVASVAIDPKTGQILAMVGSRDYFDREIDGNFNVATAHRQPGSSFKPFAYATAFNKGYTPSTVLFDVETEFSTLCSPDSKPLKAGASCYNPKNYDDKAPRRCSPPSPASRRWTSTWNTSPRSSTRSSAASSRSSCPPTAPSWAARPSSPPGSTASSTRTTAASPPPSAARRRR